MATFWVEVLGEREVPGELLWDKLDAECALLLPLAYRCLSGESGRAFLHREFCATQAAPSCACLIQRFMGSIIGLQYSLAVLRRGVTGKCRWASRYAKAAE